MINFVLWILWWFPVAQEGSAIPHGISYKELSVSRGIIIYAKWGSWEKTVSVVAIRLFRTWGSLLRYQKVRKGPLFVGTDFETITLREFELPLTRRKKVA